MTQSSDNTVPERKIRSYNYENCHIVKNPSVYLVGYSILETDTLLLLEKEYGIQAKESCVGDPPQASPPESLVTMAGRVCYYSYNRPRPGGISSYISRLKEAGHFSVLEHAVYNFLVFGVSRSLTHELVRHRHFSFSQLSQRYVDNLEGNYVEPPAVSNDIHLKTKWLECITKVHQIYEEFYKFLQDFAEKESFTSQPFIKNMKPTDRKKYLLQTARSLLPNATETKIFFTANARALRHFFELRASPHADVEIRRLANIMFDLVYEKTPLLFDDYRKTFLEDGTFSLSTDFPGA